MTNHRQEAEHFLEHADLTEDKRASEHFGRIAQAHATLALVEAQQEATEQSRVMNQTANLIGWAVINGYPQDVMDEIKTALGIGGTK